MKAMSKGMEEEKCGEKNGKYKYFNGFAILISEGTYVNGEKHGTWKEYYDHTGSLLIEEDYHHGVKHGRFTSYHPNGALMSEGHFSNGCREGVFRAYDEEGNITRMLMFRNDELIGESVEDVIVR